METDLLIIGAGPYGLAAAAAALQNNIRTVCVGEPMGFWARNMPKGMLLRSPSHWHLDPKEELTFERFVHESGRTVEQVVPIPVEVFLEYAEWFRQKRGIEPVRARVETLRDASSSAFVAELDDGRSVTARVVVVATGLRDFRVIPPAAQALPADKVSHSSDWSDFAELRGKRCLVVGGRQSAFESAALMAESGVARVHIAYRHDTPAFDSADDTWMDDALAKLRANSGWFAALSADEQARVHRRAWEDGRLRLEPWLVDRIRRPEIELHDRCEVAQARIVGDEIEAQLTRGDVLRVDRVVCATGFKVDLDKVALLKRGGLSPAKSATRHPVLDRNFESSIRGLFFAGITAMEGFGPFFNFSVGARTAANIIVAELARRQG